MARYADITPELVGRMAAHHDADHTAGREFAGDNGLVLVTRPGWKTRPSEVFGLTDRIGRVVRGLRNCGIANLTVGDGTFFMLVSIKRNKDS